MSAVKILTGQDASAISGQAITKEYPMRLLLLAITLCLTLTACGTKGPIYLPERQYPQANQ
jgi:hypothetical protein